jgi:hypothetical protein
MKKMEKRNSSILKRYLDGKIFGGELDCFYFWGVFPEGLAK